MIGVDMFHCQHLFLGGESMTTGNDIINYLKSNYDAKDEGNNLYSIQRSWTDGRSQLVLVAVQDKFVSISSPVAKLEDVNLDKLVKLVSGVCAFGVRIIGDWVEISNVGFVETMDALELDVPIIAISETADEIEKAITGGADVL
jgi:hypothetical protein